jgi:hypothetical protein
LVFSFFFSFSFLSFPENLSFSGEVGNKEPEREFNWSMQGKKEAGEPKDFGFFLLNERDNHTTPQGKRWPYY